MTQLIEKTSVKLIWRISTQLKVRITENMILRYCLVL